MKKISIIDSHTGGEPTRLIVDGGPELGSGLLSERLQLFAEKFDHFRSAVVCEPRGSEVIVGALTCKPDDATCTAGVIFFNNVGYLGMCGHGMIGFISTLAYQEKIAIGRHRIETPVGIVETQLHADLSVTVHNVPAYRHRKDVSIEVAGVGSFTGDVAWGGNWFFLIAEHGQDLRLENVDALTDFCWRVRQALKTHGVTGKDGALIDHIELFGPPGRPENHSRNFVLCPGKAYDRSPCGTGTSAKLACLAADGKLAESEIWRQESFIGSVFEAYYRLDPHADDGSILPSIKGTAYINAEATLLLDPHDPFVWGIR
jgi:4-hydroxyproline epimerase